MGTALLSGICGGAVHGWGGLVEGLSIIIASLLIMLIGTFADYKKDQQFVGLQSLIKEEDVPVIRGKFGATQSISVWDLVVGDVVLLSAGSRVPADCLVINSADLEVEEALEDEENSKKKVRKSAFIENGYKVAGASNDPFLYADSLITKGSAKAVVCCVGA